MIDIVRQRTFRIWPIILGAILATYEEAKDLIEIGASYKKGPKIQ